MTLLLSQTALPCCYCMLNSSVVAFKAIGANEEAFITRSRRMSRAITSSRSTHAGSTSFRVWSPYTINCWFNTWRVHLCPNEVKSTLKELNENCRICCVLIHKDEPFLIWTSTGEYEKHHHSFLRCSMIAHLQTDGAWRCMTTAWSTNMYFLCILTLMMVAFGGLHADDTVGKSVW